VNSHGRITNDRKEQRTIRRTDRNESNAGTKLAPAVRIKDSKRKFQHSPNPPVLSKRLEGTLTSEFQPLPSRTTFSLRSGGDFVTIPAIADFAVTIA